MPNFPSISKTITGDTESLDISKKEGLLKESFDRWLKNYPEKVKQIEDWTTEMRKVDPNYKPWLDKSFLDPTRSDHDTLYKYIEEIKTPSATKPASSNLLSFASKKPRFPSVGKALGVAGTVSDIADIAHGDIAEGALGLGSLVAGRASPYLSALKPEKTVSEEMESRQLQEAKERQESEEETKYKREALRRLMSSQEE